MQNLKDQLEVFLSSNQIIASEKMVVKRMLGYLQEQGDAGFFRDARPAHFTASALVLSPDRSKVLLLWHKKLQNWLQPGGHADGDTNLKNVAAREVQEETGVDVSDIMPGIYGVDWHPIPANAKEGAHEHADCAFLFEAKGWNLVRQVEEAEEVKWFLPQEALELVKQDGSITKLIRRYFGGSQS